MDLAYTHNGSPYTYSPDVLMHFIDNVHFHNSSMSTTQSHVILTTLMQTVLLFKATANQTKLFLHDISH